MERTRPHAALFDLDGTLVDSRPAILRSVCHVLAELGHPAPALPELHWFVGPPLEHGFRRLLSRFGDDRVEAAVASYRRHYAAHGLLDGPPFPGIPELLEALAGAGVRLFVATSKREDFAARAVEAFGLARYFAGVHGAAPGRPEEKAALIARLVARHGLAPETAAMIGDREHDVIGARANGLRAIGVLYGYGSREELAAAGADALAGDPAELLRLLGP
jgi:phosphoglycolate phosphatase